MASFSLDDIRAAADAKYASTDITFVVAGEDRTLTLVNALRLNKAKRDELMAVQDSADDDTAEDKDQEEMVRSMVRLVASNESVANEFLAQVGDDLALLMVVFDKYSKGTQLGEASASAN